MLYDADCGFCTRAARLVPRLGMRVDVAPLQSCDLAPLGIDAVRSGREMPFVASDGTVSYVHGANIVGFIKVADAMIAQGII